MTLAAESKNDCIFRLHLNQVTDAQHFLKTPVQFTTEDSVSQATGELTDQAQHQIDLFAARLRVAASPGIQLVPLPGQYVSEKTQHDMAGLERLIKEALQRKGLSVAATGESSGGFFCQMHQQFAQPALCLDAWLPLRRGGT